MYESHFKLLLRWLETHHVNKYWDSDIIWNEELIKEKYQTYVEGYKILKLKSGEIIKKPINGFIIIYEELLRIVLEEFTLVKFIDISYEEILLIASIKFKANFFSFF